MANNAYRVIFHYEQNSRKTYHDQRSVHVIATTPDPAGIATILANNGLGAPSGATLVIDSVINSGAGAYLT